MTQLLKQLNLYKKKIQKVKNVRLNERILGNLLRLEAARIARFANFGDLCCWLKGIGVSLTT